MIPDTFPTIIIDNITDKPQPTCTVSGLVNEESAAEKNLYCAITDRTKTTSKNVPKNSARNSRKLLLKNLTYLLKIFFISLQFKK